ncbi:plasmid maintenance system killer protein [Paenibacillus sp. FSL H7-0350]|uniref:type II toxin-antitoxin system RelE/ParE family toxin n=1 Tax=Paenibacillus sp. FSL H7-0350 TaxID=2975345 RepID=UPI0031592D60
MNISYNNTKLEKVLTNERSIKREYTLFHKKLINRMSELRVANNLEEIPHVPPPNRHKLSGDYNDCWGIDVSKNFRIVLRPIGEWEASDLRTIQNVEIITVEDYH